MRSQEAQDARLVGRQLVDDPGVGRMGVLDIGDIGRTPQQFRSAAAQFITVESARFGDVDGDARGGGLLRLGQGQSGGIAGQL
ncbi:Uncharacterised protein [Mycobacteroides abscessus subsp. abscessus]|nr:Uncharacterised protein [Mycobacteroides abscessus subsp. abscessus]